MFGKLLCWMTLHKWRFDRVEGVGIWRCGREECEIHLLALMQLEYMFWRPIRRSAYLFALFALLLWSTTVWGSPPPAVHQDVEAAALWHGLPPLLLDALHFAECSRRTECPRGQHGEWFAFQIGGATAFDAGCSGRWRTDLRDNADCAARVLILKGAKPGRYLGALAGYNGCRTPCRSNWYAWRVYRDWLRAEMAVVQAQLLARR